MASSIKKYNKILVKLSRYMLNRGLNAEKRNPVVCSLNNAQTVGVSFVVNSYEELNRIKAAIRAIESHNCKVIALGYIPEKKPDEYYLTQKKICFFSNKDTDWLYRPTNELVLEFIENRFDILIDLGSDNYFPMEIVLHKAKAKFKVGWFGEEKPFDLMLNIKKSKGIEYFCEQAIKYLSQFK